MVTFLFQVFKEKFRVIEFRFVNNQGNRDYTCVYRVHVHGNISWAFFNIIVYKKNVILEMY